MVCAQSGGCSHDLPVACVLHPAFRGCVLQYASNEQKPSRMIISYYRAAYAQVVGSHGASQSLVHFYYTLRHCTRRHVLISGPGMNCRPRIMKSSSGWFGTTTMSSDLLQITTAWHRCSSWQPGWQRIAHPRHRHSSASPSSA